MERRSMKVTLLDIFEKLVTFEAVLDQYKNILDKRNGDVFVKGK